jgi:SPP1 family predicted phage head-tail adaptor
MADIAERFTGRGAGRYNKRITVKQATDSKASTGETVQTYTALDTASPSRWAAVHPLGGTEDVNAEELVDVSTHRVAMRWDKAMSTATPKMVIDYGTRRFQITQVNNTQEANIELVFMCREAV